jgi:CYTH domain-containing protein
MHPDSIHRITQIYLMDVSNIAIRARLVESFGQERGILTLKGPSDVEGAVGEYEMDIPAEYVRTLIRTTDMVVVKDRYHVNLAQQGLLAEIDVFDGWHKGLIVVEVEFDSPEKSKEFEAPCWFGREVTGDKSYANVNLAKKKSKFWLTS